MKTKAMLPLLLSLVPVAGLVPTMAVWAASYTTAAGDASFRRINATAGKLTGVDLSGSTVSVNGARMSLSTLAQQVSAAAQSTVSDLGIPGGAAELDSTGTLSSNLAEATGGSVARTLAAHFSDTLNAADFGVVCDGSTDNTAAITNRLLPAVNASRAGAEVDWPAGVCVLSSQVTATITRNVLFRGHGPTATLFHFTGASSNGFHFYANSAAAIEWEETAIDTTATTPSADALLIEGYNAHNGSLPHNNAGWVVVDHNQIEGNFWAGIHLRNLNFATVSYNRITASAGPAVTSAYPSPNNLTTDPVASIIGSSASATAGTSVGTAGIFFEGSGADYLIDPKVVGNSIVNGTAQIEMDTTQGGYMAANSLFNGTYGVRSTCGANMACENLTFTTGYVFDSLDDFYFEGMDGYQVTSNFMWVSGASSTTPAGGTVGVFVRDGDGGAVTGNTIQAPGPGSAPAIPQWAWFVGNDTATSKPWVFGPNSIYDPAGSVYIGNDANTSGVLAQGNAIAEATLPASGTSIVDATMTTASPFGSNDYVFNATPYGDAKSDGTGDLSFRRSLRCGGPYDTCTFTQIVNGSTVFATDASGDVASTGQQELYTGGGYREFTSVVFGTVATGTTMQLTPSGAFPTFASTTASAAVAAAATTLTVSNGALFTTGMGLRDTTSGAVATIASVSSNTLTLSTGGLSAAVASGDAIATTLPTAAELGLGTLNANNGTLTARNGYCVSGSTRFTVDLTQLYGGYGLSGAMTTSAVTGTMPSGVAFSAGRDSVTGAPALLMANSTGASITCRFDETFASSPL